MSFEGYYQFWCPKGHYWSICSDVVHAEEERVLCPVCFEFALYANLVDNTNYDNDGFIETEVISKGTLCQCSCGNVHIKKGEEPVYKLPTHLKKTEYYK